VIKPNKDKVIFSDRGLVSGIAYALANDESLETEKLIEFNRFALQESLPDIVFVFKTTKKLLFKRLSNKSHDSIEKRGVEYLLRVQEYILKVCKRLEIEMHEIDASKKIEEINKEILLVLKSKGVKS
jgi:dTMP kinase